MKTISLCMIVKNEELVLERCLSSIKNAVDEIIIVDTGSTDTTKEIAYKFTDKVYDFEWVYDFSKARNYSISKATCDYVMWLDADDYVPPSTVKKINELKEDMASDVYMLKYNTGFTGGKCTFSFYRERILRNCENCVFMGAVHECIVPFGNIEHLDIAIEHHKEVVANPTRNLDIYLRTKRKRKLDAREQYYFSREYYESKKYKKCIKEFEKFVQMPNAWIENVLDAYYLMYKSYLALNNKQKAIDCILQTLKLNQPRANICCAIGDYLLEEKKYEDAAYWFEQATKCKSVVKKGAFVEDQYYNYHPYLQLCVCYYNLGDVEKSIKYNEKAGKFYNTQTVVDNRKFFESLNKK